VATEKELQAQLNIQTQINKMLQKRAGLLKGVTSEISAQVSMAQELCKALDCEDLDGMKERMEGFGEALKQAREGAEGASSATDQLGDAAKKSAKSAKSLGSELADLSPKAVAAASAIDAIGGVKNTLSSVWDTVTGLGSSLMNIGGSILGAVSSGIGFLANASMQAGNANVGFANAMNKLNGTFGEASAQANNVNAAFNNLKSGGDAMSQAGVSLRDIYGAGPDGLAAAMEDITALAEEMGTEFNKLGDDFAKNTGLYMNAYKGLGLTGEAISEINRRARSEGRDASDYLAEQARSVTMLSRKYGLSAKQIGKNLDEMAKDYETFGGLSQTEMAATAAFAAKLGVEMKALQGITAKTDDFEGAAQAASELAASFGMTVDAMEMMSADPAEKAEMVRQAFLETGKSFEDMSRQEKARMAEITGMGGKDLAGLFDPANADIGLDEMQAAAEDAADGAITQEEANMHLAKSITKLTEAFGGMTQVGGPFDAFLQGITQGIMKSPQMQKILENFREVLMIIFDAGKQIGKLFMELFPGMDQFATGLGELLNPEQWRAAMGEVVDAFRDFFNLLESDPEQAMENLIDKIKEIFGNFFGGNEGASMMQEGFAKMWSAIKAITGFLAKKLAEVMYDVIVELVKTPEFKKGMAILGAAITAKTALGLILGAAKAVIAAKLKDMLMKKFAPGLADGAKQAGEAAGDAAGEGMSEGVEQQKSIIETLRDIKQSDITKAFKIGLYLVGFVMIAMVGLATAFMVVSKIISVLSPQELAQGIVGLGAALAATYVMIRLAKMMKEADILKAGIGMLAAGLMFKISGKMYAEGLRDIHSILEGIDLMRMVEVMGMLGMALLATWGMILLGSLLVADGGMMMAMTTLGMLAAGLMFMVTAPIFGLGLVTLHDIMDGIDLMRMIEVMGMLGMALLATWGMIAVGAMLGTALVPIALAVLGSIAAGGLFGVMAEHMGNSLVLFYQTMSGVDGQRLSILMGNLIVALGAVLLFLPVAAAFGLMLALQPFGGAGIKLIKAGFGVLGEFAESMVNAMAPALILIANMPLGDPKQLFLKIMAIVALLQTVHSFSGVAIALAGLELINQEMGGDSGTIMEGAAKFMDSMMGGLSEMIQAMTLLTALIRLEDIPKLEAIGAIIGAIASVIQAIQPPPGLLEAMKPSTTISWRGVSTQAAPVGAILKSYSEAVTGMMKSMTTLLPPFFQAIMTVDLGDDPEKAKIKMEAISGVIKAIGQFAKDIGEISAMIMCMNYEQQSWAFGGPKMADTIREFNKSLRVIMKAVRDYMPALLESVIEAAKNIDGSEKSIKKMEVVSMAISAIGQFASGIGAMSDLVPQDDSWNPFADKPDRLGEMTKMITGIVTSVKDTLPGLVTALLSVNVQSGAGEKLDIISRVIDEMSHFTSTLGGMAGEMEDPAGFAEWKTKLASVMGTIIQLIDPTIFNSELPEGQASLKQVVEALGTMTGLEAAATNMENMATFMTHLATFGQKMEVVGQMMMDFTADSVAESVGAAITAYNQTGIELARIRHFDINAVMEDVGTALSVRRQQVTVEDNGISIVMNLNVTMEADDVANVLVDKNLVVAGTALEGQGDVN